MAIRKFNESVGPKRELVIKKGYTLTVVSWENDGDHYNTKTKTVETEEEAKSYYELAMLCTSKNRTKSGLGNSHESFNMAQLQAIQDLFKRNPILLKYLDNKEDIEDEDVCQDYFLELAGELLDYSEFYLCRVMESCKVTYSPEDIYLDLIEF